MSLPRWSTGSRSPRAASVPWPTGCGRSRRCPIRWGRCSTAGSGRTVCASNGSGCRSAWWRSSTRTARTSPATPPGCASSRATRRSCAGHRAPSRRTPPSPRCCGRPTPRRDCRADALVLVDDTSREAAVEFMRQRDTIDCLIPRGGPSLIRSILDNATVPYVIDGDGNCHVYVDAVGRSRDGLVHRGQRQDAAAVGVQRRRDPPGARRGGRRLPARAGRRAGRRRAGGRRTVDRPAPRRRARPPRTTTPASSST